MTKYGACRNKRRSGATGVNVLKSDEMDLTEHVGAMSQAITQLVSKISPRNSEELKHDSVQKLVRDEVVAGLQETNASLNELKTLMVSFMKNR